MRLNPSLPLSDSFQARLAAQAILRNHFDMKKAVAELRPDIRQWRAFGQRLLAEQTVRHKIEIIMDRGDKNAQKFLDTLWSWLERLDALMKTGGVVPTRAEMEAGLTAARILAKGYLAETRSEPSTSRSPMVIEGLDSEGIQNLTGEALAVSTRKTN
jgi:hypothetical protein